MNELHLITDIKRSLINGPVTLDQLLVEHTAIWQALDWDASQVSLWLVCNHEISKCQLRNGEAAWQLNNDGVSVTPNLSDELVALLHKAGRPMPLAQLMGKLPPGMMVTEPMLRAAALKDARLELQGPLLKLA